MCGRHGQSKDPPLTFDSLTFARRLKAAGFSDSQAEALADVNRDMLVPDLATKDDLKQEIAQLQSDLNGSLTAVRAEATATEQRLQAAIEALGLRLTIRLGVMIGTATAALAAILRLH